MALIEREAALNCAEYDEHYRLVIPVGKVKELITIDPIRAAGGCRCGECKHHGAVDGPMRQCDITDDNDFCSYGEPREAKATAIRVGETVKLEEITQGSAAGKEQRK